MRDSSRVEGFTGRTVLGEALSKPHIGNSMWRHLIRNARTSSQEGTVEYKSSNAITYM